MPHRAWLECASVLPLTGGSFGFQAGGQASDLVLIIRTDDGMQHLLQSKFKLGADASASAGPVGRDAQAMTDLTLRAQVLTYSRSRGLFLGVSLSGGVIRQDDGDTRAFYGKGLDVLFAAERRGSASQGLEVLLNTVEKYAPTPKVRAQATPPPVVDSPGLCGYASRDADDSLTGSSSSAPAATTDSTTDEKPAHSTQSRPPLLRHPVPPQRRPPQLPAGTGNP